MIKLGNKVRCSLTGFEGIAVGYTEWLYGCTRVAVQSKGLHEGKPIEAQWFDEQQLEVVEHSEPQVSSSSTTEKTGGPTSAPMSAPTPTRNSDPSR